MPELPEVEAVCRRLRRHLSGRRIVAARLFRARLCAPQSPAQFARAVTGQRFVSIERRGKNILAHLERATLWAHLRLTGNLYTISDPERRPATASACLVLDNARALVFDDPRGLGMLRAVAPGEAGRALAGLGPDPLSGELTLARFAALAGGGRSSIKTLLMDQKRLAGLRNIYAAEALFRAGIDPRRPGARLGKVRLRRLHRAIVQVLREGLASAVTGYRGPGGFVETEFFQPAVYGRQGLPCRRCGRKIRRIRQSGRSTFFCPGCQR